MPGSLIRYEDALRIVLDACSLLPSEDCAPNHALGRVLAKPVAAIEPLPSFDNAAMDGYALAGTGTLAAGSVLDVYGEQAAGDDAAQAEGHACAIMTGARLPDGCDRVVALEQTETLATGADGTPTRIRLSDDVAPAQHVRHTGSDVAAATPVLDAGHVLASQDLMLLAALGIGRVSVATRPRVALLCTGRELVDDPAQPLAGGQIRNSNGPFLAARLIQAGAELVHMETVGDDIDAYLGAVDRARKAGAQILLSTGAVSMGRYDFVPTALARLGAKTLFHKVAIRPGKPVLFARLNDGMLVFGLPGNPIASAVGLRFFVEPALRAMSGLVPERPLRVPLHADYSKSPPLRFHLKTRLMIDAEGRLSAHILDGQQSYRIRPLAEANAWAVIPAELETLAAGTCVDVYGLGHLEPPHLHRSPS